MQVPSRLTSAELRAMALRQQQQIDSQHQLLATKEQRLRFLKSQEVRSAVASAEGERLRRLRERVEAQESKLRRLRALRGQVDLQKTYNVTLSKYMSVRGEQRGEKGYLAGNKCSRHKVKMSPIELSTTCRRLVGRSIRINMC